MPDSASCRRTFFVILSVLAISSLWVSGSVRAQEAIPGHDALGQGMLLVTNWPDEGTRQTAKFDILPFIDTLSIAYRYRQVEDRPDLSLVLEWSPGEHAIHHGKRVPIGDIDGYPAIVGLELSADVISGGAPVARFSLIVDSMIVEASPDIIRIDVPDLAWDNVFVDTPGDVARKIFADGFELRNATIVSAGFAVFEDGRKIADTAVQKRKGEDRKRPPYVGPRRPRNVSIYRHPGHVDIAFDLFWLIGTGHRKIRLGDDGPRENIGRGSLGGDRRSRSGRGGGDVDRGRSGSVDASNSEPTDGRGSGPVDRGRGGVADADDRGSVGGGGRGGVGDADGRGTVDGGTRGDVGYADGRGTVDGGARGDVGDADGSGTMDGGTRGGVEDADRRGSVDGSARGGIADGRRSADGGGRGTVDVGGRVAALGGETRRADQGRRGDRARAGDSERGRGETAAAGRGAVGGNEDEGGRETQGDPTAARGDEAADSKGDDETDRKKGRRTSIPGLGKGSDDDDDDDDDTLVPYAIAAVAAAGVLAVVGGTVGYYGNARYAPFGLTSGIVRDEGGLLLQVGVNESLIAGEGGPKRLMGRALSFGDVFGIGWVQPALGVGVLATSRSGNVDYESSISMGGVVRHNMMLFYGGYDVVHGSPEFSLAIDLRRTGLWGARRE